MAWAAIIVATVPIVVSAGGAVFGDWLPMQDNAYFTVRSRDVLGPHHPLLGAWSSGSKSVGTSVNNLGPLQLDLLAPFTTIGPSAGTAIGVAALNIASVLGVGLVVRRLASTSTVVLAMAATSLVAWSMAPELLIEPRQHHALILPFLCFVVLCWGLASGDRWLLPWAAFMGSLLVQTHFSYLLIVPLLGVWGVVALVVTSHRHRSSEAAGPRSWPDLRWPVTVAAGVVVVAWSQTVIDQVAGAGNLGRLRDAGSSSDGSFPGPAGGARIVGAVVATPSGWLRKGFVDFDPALSASSGVAPALGLLVVVVALVVAATWARRCRDRVATMAALTAVVALAAGVVAASRTPSVTGLGPVPYNYRWLWPVTGFAIFALLVAATSPRPSDRPRRPGSRPGVVGLVSGGLLVVLVVANLAPSHESPLVRSDLRRRPIARDLLGQLEEAAITGPVLFDRLRGAWTEPYSFLVLVTLQERGIEFTFEDDSLDVNRFGEGRADRGRSRQRLVLVTGLAARTVPEGSERIALASSLTEADLSRRAALRRQVTRAMAKGELMPTPAGQRKADEGAYPAVVALRAGDPVRPTQVRDELIRMAAAKELTGSDRQLAAVQRMVELYDREIFETVALFLGPQT